MRRLMKKTVAVSVSAMLGLSMLMTGCGKEEVSTASTTATEAMSTAKDIELVNTEGKVQSDLTDCNYDQ